MRSNSPDGQQAAEPIDDGKALMFAIPAPAFRRIDAEPDERGLPRRSQPSLPRSAVQCGRNSLMQRFPQLA